jgi:uncharacterized circularly permuted ATP-grasp superfamily protein
VSGKADAAARAYHRLLEADPAGAVRQWHQLVEAFAARGITFAGEPMPTLLRPQIVDQADDLALRASGRRLMELAERVARHAFAGDAGRLCAWLGTPAAEARWVALARAEPDVVLSRLDAFLTPAGPRFIEVNSDAPAGFGYGDVMARAFAELPVMQAFREQCALSYVPSADVLQDAVLRVWHERAGRTKPRIAIVDWADVKTRADQEILARAFRAAGHDCVLADPRELAFREGRLWGPKGPIDLVYRRTVLSEVAARAEEVRAFLAAYASGEVVFVNTFRCHLSEDKAFLALLTDEAHAGLMSEEEAAFVAARVPWTRKLEERRTRFSGVEVDLVPFVVAQRPRLVLKPAHGYGGREVLVGSETAAGAWEAAVAEAIGEPWVVQEKVEIPEEVYPVVEGAALGFARLKVNTNPFYVRGAHAGAVTRCSRSAVINVSAGGGSVPTFVVG